MHQRTTFFHGPREPVDPALLHLSGTELSGPTIDAAREDRLTVALEELPGRLASVLEDSVETLHVRWSAPQTGPPAISPLLSRLSPGLYVFHTPLGAGPPGDAAGSGASAEGRRAPKNETHVVCRLLRGMFDHGMDCQPPQTNFVDLDLARPGNPPAPATQFYAPVADLSIFAAFAKAVWCRDAVGEAWAPSIDRLDDADALDLSFERATRTLRVTAQWPREKRAVAVAALPGVERTEVGVMAADASQPTLGPQEIGMAGHVAVLGRDDHASPVMFAFPSRHRQETTEGGSGGAFSAAFLQPTGLHPTLQLRFAGVGRAPAEDAEGTSSCKLFTYLTLPRHIFADRYQLGDPLFLAAKNLTALHYMTQPVDLEAPDYAVHVWGSAALLELAVPSPSSSSSSPQQTWTAEIPLHLRYLQPADGGYRSVEVPYPEVFWACPAQATDEGPVDFSTNPFDRVHLGYDALFDAPTAFWHITPDPRVGGGGAAADTDGLLVNTIRVPVLDTRKTRWVNSVTSATILLGFAWILWKLLAVSLRPRHSKADQSISSTAKVTKKTQ